MKRWPDGSPRLPPSRCPHCGKRLNAAGVVDGTAPLPRPDDLTICFGCGEALTFDRGLRLRAIRASELAGLTPEEAADLRRVQSAVRAFLARDGG